MCLSKLLKEIKKNRNNKLKKIKFLYYGHYEPENLKSDYLNALQKSKWNYTRNKNVNVSNKVELNKIE